MCKPGPLVASVYKLEFTILQLLAMKVMPTSWGTTPTWRMSEQPWCWWGENSQAGCNLLTSTKVRNNGKKIDLFSFCLSKQQKDLGSFYQIQCLNKTYLTSSIMEYFTAGTLWMLLFWPNPLKLRKQNFIVLTKSHFQVLGRSFGECDKNWWLALTSCFIFWTQEPSWIKRTKAIKLNVAKSDVFGWIIFDNPITEKLILKPCREEQDLLDFEMLSGIVSWFLLEFLRLDKRNSWILLDEVDLDLPCSHASHIRRSWQISNKIDGAICYMLYAICRHAGAPKDLDRISSQFDDATCYMLHATGYMLYAVCYMQNVRLNKL